MSAIEKVDKSSNIPRLESNGKSVELLIGEYGEKKNILQLQTLIEKTSTTTLVAILKTKLGRNDCVSFWSYLFEGLSFGYNRDMVEKRFACVKCMLDGLQEVELCYKQTYDLIIRLCHHLSTFPPKQLIEILEICIDGIRMGDRKYICWKNLLPDVLSVLAHQPQILLNGITMRGQEFRDNIIRSLTTMRWPLEIVTPIADMFKELGLKTAEKTIVLNKFGGVLQTLAPAELPALAFQLFSMCSTCTEIMILVLAFEKYFHRFYYKKLFADMQSNSTDFDSIDYYSDKELREAEETILHHLNYCTQYKISEIQMCATLRNFNSMPDIILTPFLLSAIISMTSANREPESQRLTTSVLLHFLRGVIHSNEHEQTIADYSVWCRDTLQRKQVELDYVFTVLIDQNKQGQDVITPGLVSLAFTLLKAKGNAPLNSLAMSFLTKFIRKRFVFGQGIVQKLAEWMVVEQDQFQFGECLMMLSVADTFTVSECIKTIKYVMDLFLWIPGEQSMRMMSFILPILKLSAPVRDALIEVLSKVIKSSDQRIRAVAVYGFCMILKQLNNSNSLRSQSTASSFCTQHSISGFSLMSQATLGNRHNSHRHFDMLTLEIIGILRSCFTNSLTTKRVLYENLQRAVELNPKLVPHVLQFIDSHFRSFFRASNNIGDVEDIYVLFEKVVYAATTNAYELHVQDNLGLLIQFISHCLAQFQHFESEYDVIEIQRLLRLAMKKVITKDLQFEEKNDNWTPLKCALLEQQMNFLEGLIAYSLLTSQHNNDSVKHILPLFKAHCKLSEIHKLYGNFSRKQLQKKNRHDKVDGSSLKNITVNGVVIKKFHRNYVENIWDLSVVGKLLRVLHEDTVPFVASQYTAPLRSNVEFVRYVFGIAGQKVEALRNESEYKQLSHSSRTLKYLTDITKVVYERCILRLPGVWADFDKKTAALGAECFQQCLQTANAIYKKKFADVFLKGFDFHTSNHCKQSPAILHDLIDEFMESEQRHDSSNSCKGASDSENDDRQRILQALMQCLEVLYDNLSFEDRLTTESYSWLLKFCKCYEVKSKNLGLVHKLLFIQRQKTHSGAFFNTIAMQLYNIWGCVADDLYERDCPPAFVLKSLTVESVESYFSYLCQALRKQIDDVAYFILKANNLNFKYRIVTEDERDMCLSQLRSMERSICSQLVHISNALIHLANVCIPLGTTMDQLLKLLIQHYICLKNLTKHFLICVGSSQVCMQSTKFEYLLRSVGKSLPTNIYALVSYIEANVIDKEQPQGKHSNPKAESAKILRETKLIPKVILHLETFHRFTIVLSKKTNSGIVHFLHQGTVHDFRFHTHALKAAVERTFSHTSEISVDPSVESINQEIVDDLPEDKQAESSPNESDKECMKRDRITRRRNEYKDSKSDIYDSAAEVCDDRRECDDTLCKARSLSTSKQISNRLTKTQKPLKRKLRRCENDNYGDCSNVDDTNSRQSADIVQPSPRVRGVLRHHSSQGDGDSEACSSPTPDHAEILEHESNQESASQLFKNLTKINKKAQKRTLKEIDDIDGSNVGPKVPSKKRRRRVSIKK
ncbi:Fanconi anemia group I protein homolog [Anastrepha ludens]|uniref:Fanconi anemia group I protein homolog n=1 Tax=Anastrepha ludens TaxID=28586 RepID=UPI0023AFDF34|nr:Fanconi anemia group I protein homolog [Anastrepha ludens]